MWVHIFRSNDWDFFEGISFEERISCKINVYPVCSAFKTWPLSWRKCFTMAVVQSCSSIRSLNPVARSCRSILLFNPVSSNRTLSVKTKFGRFSLDPFEFSAFECLVALRSHRKPTIRWPATVSAWPDTLHCIDADATGCKLALNWQAVSLASTSECQTGGEVSSLTWRH